MGEGKLRCVAHCGAPYFYNPMKTHTRFNGGPEKYPMKTHTRFNGGPEKYPIKTCSCFNGDPAKVAHCKCENAWNILESIKVICTDGELDTTRYRVYKTQYENFFNSLSESGNDGEAA